MFVLLILHPTILHAIKKITESLNMFLWKEKTSNQADLPMSTLRAIFLLQCSVRNALRNTHWVPWPCTSPLHKWYKESSFHVYCLESLRCNVLVPPFTSYSNELYDPPPTILRSLASKSLPALITVFSSSFPSSYLYLPCPCSHQY